MRKQYFFILMFLLPSFAFGLNRQQQERYQNLNKEIRCVICQGQSIADSNAPLAKDMRHKIALLISRNKSDQKIRNYLAERYGDAILLRPTITRKTWLLWGFPFIALLTATLWMSRKLKTTSQKNRASY